MTILHYFLGFPPYRSGGLTRLALDLMVGQVSDENKVVAVWPGRIGFINKKIYLKQKKDFGKIINYELINPLPVPLDEGIDNYERYTSKADKNIFLKFLKDIKPDVVHIHTLMGLYSEFIDAAKELKINTVYSTHDFFGICPRVTLFRNNCICRDDNKCQKCAECNSHALSYNKIRLLQSPIYIRIKDSFLVKKMRKKHRTKSFELACNNEKSNFNLKCDYRKLRKFYIDLLQKIDTIHFNSNLTKEIYDRYVKFKNYKVINISHMNINDNRYQNSNTNDVLRLLYLGPKNYLKGYFFIENCLDELWNEGYKKFNLSLFGNIPTKKAYINMLGERYNNEELENIFKNTDVLLAPSLGYETFGFTVLEAINHCVPVIITENVGAKDVIGKGGYIIQPGDKEKFKKIIKEINYDEIQKLKSEILKLKLNNWNDFKNEIYKLY